MSLSTDDLAGIRTVFNEGFEELVEPRFDDIDSRLNNQSLKIQAIKNELADTNSKLDAGLFGVGQAIEKAVLQLSGRIDALEDDIKELYKMIAKLELGAVMDKKFARLSIERRLLMLNAELLAAAKEAGITLPR